MSPTLQHIVAFSLGLWDVVGLLAIVVLSRGVKIERRPL